MIMGEVKEFSHQSFISTRSQAASLVYLCVQSKHVLLEWFRHRSSDDVILQPALVVVGYFKLSNDQTSIDAFIESKYDLLTWNLLP